MEWGPRRQGRGPSSVAFDLLPEGDEEQTVVVAPPEGALPDGAAPTAIEPSIVNRASRRAWAWLRGRTPVQLVAGALVLAVSVTGGVAVHHRHGQARTARLAAAPGGVFDLATPVGERWELDVDDGAFPLGQTLLGAVLDERVGVVAQPVMRRVTSDADDVQNARYVWSTTIGGGEQIWVHDGWSLLGVDLDSGDRLWTHEAAQDTECGWTVHQRFSHLSSSWWTDAAGVSDPALVCVRGQGKEAVVTTIAADGTVTERAPGAPGEHSVFAPGPGGTVWRADRVDDLLGGTDRPAALASGHVSDLLLRAEDAQTGARLWEREFAVVGWCRGWEGNRDPRHLSIFPQRDVTQVHGCGIDVALLPSGEPVDAFTWASEELLRDGGMVRPTFGTEWGTVGSEIVDRAGDVFLEVAGTVLDPLATDGQGGIDLRIPADERDPAGLILVAEEGVVRAIDGRGEEVWSAEPDGDPRGAVARAGGVVVLYASSRVGRTAESRLVALDQRSGAVRWDVPLEGAHGLGSSLAVRSAGRGPTVGGSSSSRRAPRWRTEHR